MTHKDVFINGTMIKFVVPHCYNILDWTLRARALPDSRPHNPVPNIHHCLFGRPCYGVLSGSLQGLILKPGIGHCLQLHSAIAFNYINLFSISWSHFLPAWGDRLCDAAQANKHILAYAISLMLKQPSYTPSRNRNYEAWSCINTQDYLLCVPSNWICQS
jgi:hypothetical protein